MICGSPRRSRSSPRTGPAPSADRCAYAAAVTELQGDQVVLRTVVPDDVPELLRILRTPEVRRWWRDEAEREGWPFDDPSEPRFAIRVEGRVVGLVQYGEEEDPDYRHASIDIFLDPAFHGRAIGRDAIRTLARYLIHHLGHHRLTIDPAADNRNAIRAYAAVGFRPVGIMRQYEKNADGHGWHDGLLMDLLADEMS